MAGSTQDFRSQFSKVVSSIITQGSIDQEKESGAKKKDWVGLALYPCCLEAAAWTYMHSVLS